MRSRATRAMLAFIGDAGAALPALLFFALVIAASARLDVRF